MNKLLTAIFFILTLSACVDQLGGGEYLFQKYFEVFPIQISEETNRAQPELKPAYDAYSSGDFVTALKLTSDYTRNVAELPVVMMAQSMGYIHVDSLEQADKTLHILEAHPVIGDDATWYRALLKVKEGDYESALNFLARVPRSGDSELTQKAIELQAEIESN